MERLIKRKLGPSKQFGVLLADIHGRALESGKVTGDGGRLQANNV